MAQNDPLPELIHLLLKELLPTVDHALAERAKVVERDPLTGSDSFLVHPSERTESLTKQILDELGPRNDVRDARDIVGALDGDKLSAVSSSEEYKIFLAEAANRLRSPNRSFRFRVPISTRSSISIDWELGGADSLAIRNCSPGDERIDRAC